MTGQTSKGQCNLCGGTFSKPAMTKHLGTCKQNEQDSGKSFPGRNPRQAEVFHLVVEGRYSLDYWMHLDVPADLTLEDLDDFLRDIWLECCGHLSAFEIEGTTYSVQPMEDFDDESMEAGLDSVLSPGMKFHYEYDFGSTTHLALKVISQEQKQIKGKSIAVLARNEPPSIPCMSCGKIATQVCTECLCSDSGGWLCDECAVEHQCGEDMLLPVVNSPRVGVCGYTGE
ncbi:MAG: hypothetical protein WAV28_09365 [Sedimentisphaerales bacterium]